MMMTFVPSPKTCVAKLIVYCTISPVKTRLFSSFFLSLYGASLWRSSPQLRAFEVSFNNILRKIWSLPRHSHTRIVHSVARLESIYHIVVIYSRSVLASARRSNCVLISDLFSECAQSAYTALGYNNLFGGKHLKCYNVDDELCAVFTRDARSDPGR